MNTNTMKTNTTSLRVERGAYRNTANDRIDRWYITGADGHVDRLGRGYRTRRLAQDALAAMRLGIEYGVDWQAMPRD